MLAFSSCCLVPWSIRNKWSNCLFKTRQMNFIVSHIYREDNTCADLLANIDLTTSENLWWDECPSEIRGDLIRNKLGLPNYRFVNLWGWLWYRPPTFFSCFSFWFNIFFWWCIASLVKKKKRLLFIIILLLL